MIKLRRRFFIKKIPFENKKTKSYGNYTIILWKKVAYSSKIFDNHTE